MTEEMLPNRVQLVRHEIVRRDLEVVRVEKLTPHFLRVTFAGEVLDGFYSASFDDHVKFILDVGTDEPVMRDYTPRKFDAEARELTIEFALHGHGPAANWAATVKPGQRAVIAGPRGSHIIPMDYAWHVLIGDETALPAIARRLEELPADAKVTVFAQVTDPRDRREFVSSADVQIHWLDNPQALLDAVNDFALAPGEGYVWCAAEAGTIKSLRRIIVDEKGHSRNAIRTSAYWKLRTSAFHENIES